MYGKGRAPAGCCHRGSWLDGNAEVRGISPAQTHFGRTGKGQDAAPCVLDGKYLVDTAATDGSAAEIGIIRG